MSTAGLIVGVAGAGTSSTTLAVAGAAAVAAGAISMAVGEYVSVAAQRDTETAVLVNGGVPESDSEQQVHQIAETMMGRGVRSDVAHDAAAQMVAHDAAAALAHAHHGLSADDVANPWVAALASFVSFTVGALLPLLVIVLSPAEQRIAATAAAVIASLALTGSVAARLGGTSTGRSVLRNVAGGVAAMALTYAVGATIGASL